MSGAAATREISRPTRGARSRGRPSRRLRAARMLSSAVPPAASMQFLRALYRWPHALADDHEFITSARTGSPFRGVTSDWHCYPFSVHGYSEWRLWAIARVTCAPGDSIVECGAHVGTETIGFADIVGGGGRVLAWEPNPFNRERLEHNAALAQHRNITVVPCAVGERPGRLRFACPPPGASTGVGHLLGPEEARTGAIRFSVYSTMEGADPAASETIDVHARPLDSFIDEVHSVSLVAADTEGAELALLRGGRELIERDRPALALEASVEHQQRAGASLDELAAELAALEYRIFGVGRAGLSDDPSVGDWLCLPPQRLGQLRQLRRSLRWCGLLPFTLGLNPLGRVTA